MSTAGVGGTNYRNWDKLAENLVTQTEEEEKLDKEAASEALGHTRVPYSEAEAEERAKAEMARKAKEALDKHRERESNSIVVLEDLLKDGKKDAIVDEQMLGEKRVLSLRQCRGPGVILLPAALSTLSHPTRSIGDDDDDKKNGSTEVAVGGVIKVFIEDCHDCIIQIECKIITSVIEIHKCSNVQIDISKERLSTIQADICSGLTVRYMDESCFGGKEDKIYHAGVSQMKVVVMKRGSEVLMEKSMDYLKDGAVAQLNATPEEYQFVTSVLDGKLVTERLIRMGKKALTQRELDEERLKRGKVKNDFNSSNDSSKEDNELSLDEIKDIIQQCIEHKEEGNEAFKTGEYAQAVLFYSMAIDKSSGLKKANRYSFEERHICYANRSACFLKLGHHEKALADAETCEQLDPNYIKGIFRKGLALHAMNRYEEAMPVLARCLKIEPKNKQVKQALQFCEVKLQMELKKRMGGK